MTKKEIALILILVVVAAMAGIRTVNGFRYRTEVQQVRTHYIFDRTFRAASAPSTEADHPYDAGGRANGHTLAFFARTAERYPPDQPVTWLVIGTCLC